MGMDILVVDDEVEFADAFGERLSLRGFTAHIANSGEQALRIIDQGIVKVMVLDLKMPGMDGLEVLRRVKKSHPEVEVIILSGHGSEMDESYVRTLGAFEYFRKPADIGDILEAVKRAERRLAGTAS